MTFEEAIPELFGVISRYGARPDVPIEAAEFFTGLVTHFEDPATLRRHLEAEAAGWFRSLRGQPDWIQDAEWPWSNGRPMVFVGSIDAPSGTFHDEARFYVFWSPETGTRECVVQVA
ncbi:hypothetical protein [Fimbriiglobus ruber]|nr:hypothetical protein [Fimbriiglobus ruber]